MKSLSMYANKLFLVLSLGILLSIYNCSSSEKPFPEKLVNVSLTKLLKDDDAKSFVNKLHFSSVTDEKNEIAFYGEGNSGVMIYLTYYESVDQAKTNYEKMTIKISPENSVFINGSYFDEDGINIFRCFGMGQTHFVFYIDERLYWLSVPTMGNKKYLKEYLNHIE